MPDMAFHRLVWSMIGKSWNMPDMAFHRLGWSMIGKSQQHNCLFVCLIRLFAVCSQHALSAILVLVLYFTLQFQFRKKDTVLKVKIHS